MRTYRIQLTFDACTTLNQRLSGVYLIENILFTKGLFNPCHKLVKSETTSGYLLLISLKNKSLTHF